MFSFKKPRHIDDVILVIGLAPQIGGIIFFAYLFLTGKI